jgi:regulator of RNase E activity RraB
MDEAAIMQSIEGHKLRNADLLALFKERGTDLAAKRSVDLHFYVNDQNNAALLAKHLYGFGYLILVISPSMGAEDPTKSWNVEAGASLSINDVVKDAFSDKMARTAASYSGIYDGWGTVLESAT